jgi:hypothetical protein
MAITRARPRPRRTRPGSISLRPPRLPIADAACPRVASSSARRPQRLRDARQPDAVADRVGHGQRSGSSTWPSLRHHRPCEIVARVERRRDVIARLRPTAYLGRSCRPDPSCSASPFTTVPVVAIPPRSGRVPRLRQMQRTRRRSVIRDRVPDPPPTPTPAYRVRYFSPLMEVPFCGHATIAAASLAASGLPATAAMAAWTPISSLRPAAPSRSHHDRRHGLRAT